MQRNRISVSVMTVCLLGLPLVGAQDGRDPDSFLFLIGQVLRVDGTPPSDSVRIEFECGGQVLKQVYTGDKGDFRFEIGRQQAQGWTDAGVGRDRDLESSGHWNSSIDKSGTFAASPFKTFNLSSCEIHVVENQGYHGNTLDLGSRSAFDDPTVGVIIIRKEGERIGSVISVKSLSAPEVAREDLEKAREELDREKPDLQKAVKWLTSAVEEYPELAEAWYLIGECELQRNDSQEARKAFQEAISAEPDYVKPYLPLARIELFEEQWQSAADLMEQFLLLSQNSDQGHYFNGLSNYYLGRYRKAEESFIYLRDNELGERYPIALFYLAVMHAQAGKVQDAAIEFRDYLKWMPPDQVPAEQRKRIENQLGRWQNQGLIQ